ncbi:MAG: cytochrome c-type biogenesis protein CcmH [Methylacidiphilales bacterium]|nr:cytochrome c-type biogenesis protein CcmH [Candidatus Methylacidiphilales bacterium]
MKLLFIIIVNILASLVAHSEDETPPEYYSVVHNFRCLVCQNQSIAESDAPLAVQMRNEIKVMLQQGASQSEIKTKLSNQFGEYILYDPVISKHTMVLWFSPLLILLISIYFLLRKKR